MGKSTNSVLMKLCPGPGAGAPGVQSVKFLLSVGSLLYSTLLVSLHIGIVLQEAFYVTYALLLFWELGGNEMGVKPYSNFLQTWNCPD